MSLVVAETVGSLRRRLAVRIDCAFRDRGAGATPALDARLLLAHALGVEANTLALADDQIVERDAALRAEALVDRRIAGEPVARVIGRQEFWGLDFILGPATLVPRPDTETVVEAALDFLRARMPEVPPSILDLGTGSGAILLALLSELPRARGLGVDLSPEAVAIAHGNAERLGLGTRAEFVVGDWASSVGRRFDCVVSNPPYIESAIIPTLAAEVRDHDPRLALDGGPDGLDAYRAILASLPERLSKGGAAFLEIGHRQGGAVAEMAGKSGFSVRIRPDLAGRDRVVELKPLADG